MAVPATPARAPIAAIYAFARTADDLADEGNASSAERLHDLAIYRADLHATAMGNAASACWPEVFAPGWRCCEPPPARALCWTTCSAPLCKMWKNPRQRGLRHRCRVAGLLPPLGQPGGPRCCCTCTACTVREALRESDAICTALQLINFWQDLSVDIPRGASICPTTTGAAHGVEPSAVAGAAADASHHRAHHRTRPLGTRTMLEGAPLVHRLPGRIG